MDKKTLKPRLSQAQWATIEARILAGEQNRPLAREYGISESAIRSRFGQVKKIKVEDAAAKIVEAREALQALPPMLRPQANKLADALQEISYMTAQSAQLAAQTAFRMSRIANIQANKLNDEAPDIETTKLIHGLTETSNKAAYQPLELLKVNKDMMGESERTNHTAMPSTIVICGPDE